ncbi:amidohydrolase [Microbacterium marinilacus]|uniref:Peptidase M20 domain-containing protein 2 n=1 Tax=Microbacterium marinilacus TaxID=415209 RepID=A0ABP7B5Q5_9MICO|nr:amidohydrolase [Microbacterium marinilacus]MBY0687583.1 amidohydrolase [Microbacterium marinilacus]
MSDPLAAALAWQARTAAGAPPARVDEPSRFAGAPAALRDESVRAVDGLRPELERLAIALHEDPEIGFEEHRSAGRLAELLERHGHAAAVGAFGLPTALRVTAGAADGPHFAIIAEYDALPGVGHACGHNIIAGAAVGAFLAVAPIAGRLGGRVSLIGTPAEENGAGKELILRAGGFDDVDAAGMVHPAAGSAASPLVAQRTTGVRRVAVTYHGRAAHAAGAPWLGLNALDAVVTAYQGVAQLRQHILPIDRVHGIITDGGAAPNVVPERAAALFYVRSAEIDTLVALTDRVVAVLEGAALSTGTRAEIDVDPVPPYLPLQPNLELTRRWAAAVAGRGREVPPSPPVAAQGGASTDMGNVTRYLPSIHPSIGLGGPDDVTPHNAAFAAWTVQPPAFDALADAAAGLAAAAVDYLADPELREAVAAEFAAEGGRFRWGDPL